MVKRGRANCFICKDKDATATGNTKNEMLARLRDFGIKVVELPDGNVKVFVEGKCHDYSTYLKFCNACGVKGPAMGELSESQLAAIKKAKREPLGVHALYQTPALPARPAHTWAPGSLPSAPKFEISVDVVATRAREESPAVDLPPVDPPPVDPPQANAWQLELCRPPPIFTIEELTQHFLADDSPSPSAVRVRCSPQAVCDLADILDSETFTVSPETLKLLNELPDGVNCWFNVTPSPK